MAEWWRRSVPDGLPVEQVVGVCFDRADKVVMILRGLTLALPSTRVHGGESPDAALNAWLGRAGIRVLRSGTLGYKRQPQYVGGPGSAVAYRVAVVECAEPNRIVSFTRVRVNLAVAGAAARRGGVGRARLRVAADIASRFLGEIDAAAPPRREGAGSVA